MDRPTRTTKSGKDPKPRVSKDSKPPVVYESYSGERLGLPAAGVGAVAGYPRRIGALMIDWIACAFIAQLLFPMFAYGSVGSAWAILGTFCATKTIFTVLGGSSFGERILGIRVMSLNKPYVDPVRALVRSVLICLVIPACVYDLDGRGLQDKAAGTIVVKRRK